MCVCNVCVCVCVLFEPAYVSVCISTCTRQDTTEKKRKRKEFLFLNNNRIFVLYPFLIYYFVTASIPDLSPPPHPTNRVSSARDTSSIPADHDSKCVGSGTRHLSPTDHFLCGDSH